MKSKTRSELDSSREDERRQIKLRLEEIEVEISDLQTEQEYLTDELERFDLEIEAEQNGDTEDSD